VKSALAAIGLIFCAHSASAACSPDRVTVVGEWGQAHFNVTIADDNAERAQGLMFVEQMPVMTGMLFVYDHPQSVSFWMRNTLIPLDMLFVAPTGEILKIHENAIPQDTTPIPGGDGVQMVFEINGGIAARLGIEIGNVLQHPSFGGEAILPCDEKSDD
jgi:uncharacterized membrane protein (UPF0127 family)